MSKNNSEEIIILTSYINDLITNNKSIVVLDLANLFYKFYKDIYKCTSLKFHKWYEFKEHEHRWVALIDDFVMRQKISDDLIKKFSDLFSHYNTNSGDYIPSKVNRLLECINNIIRFFKKTSFKNELSLECQNLFYDENFEDKLDSYKNLICFKNGVYDLKTELLRPGKQDDFLSLNINYEYEEFSFEHELVKNIETNLLNTKIDDQIKEYIMLYLASCLCGENKNELINICVDNEEIKWILNSFCKALDNYSAEVPKTLFLKNNGSCLASTGSANLKGKRFVISRDFNKKDVIDSGFIKSLSGGDAILARRLYEEKIKYYPQFKFLLIFNEEQEPFINSTDDGTFRRLRIINLDKNINNNIKLEISEKAFMWYLLNKYYPLYQKNGIETPEKIKNYTIDFRKTCNNDRNDLILNEKIKIQLTLAQLISLAKCFKMSLEDNELFKGLENIINSAQIPKYKPYYYMTYLSKEKDEERLTRDAFEYLINKTKETEDTLLYDKLLLKVLACDTIKELIFKYIPKLQVEFK